MVYRWLKEDPSIRGWPPHHPQGPQHAALGMKRPICYFVL